MPWPTDEWPEGPLDAGIDADRVAALTSRVVAEQPEDLGQTLAMLVVHRGRLVAESYGTDTDASTALISW